MKQVRSLEKKYNDFKISVIGSFIGSSIGFIAYVIYLYLK